jgi:hypothetical protein
VTQRPGPWSAMLAALACRLIVGVPSLGCSGQGGPKKQQLDEKCESGRECQYGLECRARTCQFIVFSDCEGEGRNPNGQPQCLSGHRCRDGHCTVECAGTSDCKEGETCRIGACQNGGQASRLCYDNRDCTWPEICFSGQCATRTDAFRCVSDLDCGLGFRCLSGRCT